MPLKRRILLGVCLFVLVGWVMGRYRGEPEAPPAMAPLLRRVAAIEQPLRAACRRAAALAAHPPASPRARASAVAELREARRAAAAAEAAFRGLQVPDELAGVVELRQCLEAKARMAALSAEAIAAATGVVSGDAGAMARTRELQENANRSAAEAARLLHAAMRKASRSAPPAPETGSP